MRTHDDPKHVWPKRECRTAEPEIICGTHERQEMWEGKAELKEEKNLKPLEKRGGHSGKKGFQICANSLEPKRMKVRECDMCDDWPMQQLRLHITAWKRGVKANQKSFKLGKE